MLLYLINSGVLGSDKPKNAFYTEYRANLPKGGDAKLWV